MNNQERFVYFESGELQRSTQMELLDWAGYWTSEGLDEIEAPLQKEQTRVAIRMILTDLASMVKKVSRLAISDDIIKAATAGTVTDEMIRTVVVAIMASRLEWLTGVTSVPEEAAE